MRDICIFCKYLSKWLGRSDSNTRMTESESVALPLGDAPMIDYSIIIIAFTKKNKRF